jgi:hypothetical protein
VILTHCLGVFLGLAHPRIDVEPAAFFLRGFSVHVGVERGPWLFSTGAYGFDIPGFLTADGWDARMYLGAGVFAERYLGDAGRGWLVGGQLGVQETHATMGATSARSTALLVLARGGYEWHPAGAGFYLFPWAGVAVTPKIAGDYPAPSVVPYLTVDLGWRF